jgi:hypothetical protein
MEATLTQTETASTSKARRIGGIALMALPTVFLIWDAAMKLANVAPVVEAFERMGVPDRLAERIGILELVCVAIFLVPRTAVLGAVLLTGYLGGAIALHMRLGDPLASHTLFPVYIGVMIWGGLALRDARVRALAPWSK